MDKKDKPFQITILLYPGVTALDAVGPWEVMSRMPNTEVRLMIEYFPQPPLNYKSMEETSEETKLLARKLTEVRVRKDMSIPEMAKHISPQSIHPPKPGIILLFDFASLMGVGHEINILSYRKYVQDDNSYLIYRYTARGY